jgi:ZIP family zinc transporter
MWFHAAGRGLLSGAGLLVGAAISYFVPLSHSVISSVMEFGAGVLLSVIAFQLMNEAAEHVSLISAIASFLVGALAFCTVNWFLSHYGAKNRKRCGVAYNSRRKQSRKAAALRLRPARFLTAFQNQSSLA